MKPFEFLISNFKGSVADKFKKSFPEHVNWSATVTEDDLTNVISTKETDANVIYLSADATEELEEIKDNDIIVIGGIVDRNRNKVHTPTLSPLIPFSAPL